MDSREIYRSIYLVQPEVAEKKEQDAAAEIAEKKEPGGVEAVNGAGEMVG